ncbi:MAG: hypothetical protein AAGA93_12785 [Actinomycetota bacterium]
MAEQMTDRSAGERVAEAVALPVLEYGRGWMAAPATAARAGELGFGHPMGFWVNGRAGVLGDVDGDVAAAAIGFMAPGLTRRLWEERPAGLSPTAATVAYAEAAAAWGRETLADLADDDLSRLADLVDRVCAAALPSVGILFAGWRALPTPGDPAGRATVVLNVLRELRGGAHLSAVDAVGIGPHGAILAAPDPVRGGPAGADRFGWPEPHPEPAHDRRAEAERLTTAICGPAFAALTDDEGQELIELVGTARAAMDR